ncbi:uncharacterized protein TNCV_3210011 [Trichonephila clavipes]|nr:uncharacterized protein TNCV_3210011 [Trichonephila clavipes]
MLRGCGSPVVNISDHDRYIISSSPVPLKTRRVGQRCPLNLSTAETSSRFCSVVVRRGGVNSDVVPELWFQQDGATCHTARATIDLLKDTFGDRLISRFGPVNWPPRSCDLTPLDYFLWGYVKSLVYADKPQTLDHLEDNIRRIIADIRPQMLEKVIENWTSRLDYIRASRGSPMPEIIFKMTATAGSNVVQSGRPIFDDFFQHLWPYIGNNTANVVFQMVKRFWLIRIDQ